MFCFTRDLNTYYSTKIQHHCLLELDIHAVSKDAEDIVRSSSIGLWVCPEWHGSLRHLEQFRSPGEFAHPRTLAPAKLTWIIGQATQKMNVNAAQNIYIYIYIHIFTYSTYTILSHIAHHCTILHLEQLA